MKQDFYWYWFVNIPGIGSVTRKKMIERFGHPSHIYTAKENELRKLLNGKQMTYLKKSLNKNDIEKSFRRLSDTGTQFIHWESENYPRRLRELYDPPYGFYVRGRLPEEKYPGLGMVGSRKATDYGREMAKWFAGVLAGMGVQIISGLAMGIDSSSHRGALQSGGYTAGILGGGIDTVYPIENYNLYREMYEKGGVMSEYNIGIPNRPGLFPARNRLISGLSDAIFVLEAGIKSGTFITVDQALEQGKEVFVLPGRATDSLSRGCNALIRQGATLVQSPEELLDYLGSKGMLRSKKSTLDITESRPTTGEYQGKHFSEEEKCIWNLLDEKQPVPFEILLERSGYTVAKLQNFLLKMELNGWIFQPAQNIYQRKIKKITENFSC